MVLVSRSALREYRRERAKNLGIPAYRILTNAALEGILATAPNTLAKLLQVKGVGPKTVERYGSDILRILDDTRYINNPISQPGKS